MQTLFADGERKTVLMDSISYVAAHNRGDIIVSGSHGGTSSARYALDAAVAAAVFNDAGTGKNAAGIAGLGQLQTAGIIGVAVSHESAEIGNAADTYASGVVSRTNNLAARAGVRTGMPVAAAVDTLRSYLQQAQWPDRQP